jgi:hypothetical protein
MLIISATWEVEVRRIMVSGQPRKKITETSSQQTSQVWYYMPVVPATWEA